MAIEKKLKGKKLKTQGKNSKLKKISQKFGIFEVNFWYQMFHLLYIWRNCIWKVSKAAVLGKLGPRPGPVVLRPGGYRASGRLDRAGYPAWPLYTLSPLHISVKIYNTGSRQSAPLACRSESSHTGWCYFHSLECHSPGSRGV